MIVCAVPLSLSARGIADSIDGKKISHPLVPPLSPGDEDQEEQKRRDASWKTMKYSFIAFGATFGILGSYMVYELGNSEFCGVKILFGYVTPHIREVSMSQCYYLVVFSLGLLGHGR
jgi:hypothetical protein